MNHHFKDTKFTQFHPVTFSQSRSDVMEGFMDNTINVCLIQAHILTNPHNQISFSQSHILMGKNRPMNMNDARSERQTLGGLHN